jgi:hypothetical protein
LRQFFLGQVERLTAGLEPLAKGTWNFQVVHSFPQLVLQRKVALTAEKH